MASILGEGTGPGGPGPSRCLLLLQRSLAIQLTRGPPPHVANSGQRESSKEHPADEMWMYDKGYNLFQVSLRVTHVTLCLHHRSSFHRETIRARVHNIFIKFFVEQNSIMRLFCFEDRWRRKSSAEMNVGTKRARARRRDVCPRREREVTVSTALFVSSVLFLSSLTDRAGPLR